MGLLKAKLRKQIRSKVKYSVVLTGDLMHAYVQDCIFCRKSRVINNSCSTPLKRFEEILSVERETSPYM